MPKQRSMIEFKSGEANVNMGWMSTPNKFIKPLKGYSGTKYLDSALLQKQEKLKGSLALCLI